MAKPEELPADHVVRSIPGTLETGIDFVGDTYGARGWIRVYEEGELVWYSGPHPHGVFRLMGADLLDNADRLELAERQQKARRN